MTHALQTFSMKICVSCGGRAVDCHCNATPNANDVEELEKMISAWETMVDNAGAVPMVTFGALQNVLHSEGELFQQHFKALSALWSPLHDRRDRHWIRNERSVLEPKVHL